jgi:hypothetical protein
MDEHEALCLKGMEDLKMTPEEFGSFLYDACVYREASVNGILEKALRYP